MHAPEPGEPRELRGLVIFEVAAVIGLALAPLPDALPLALPLLIVASLSRWARRRDWGELFHGDTSTALVGAAAGLAAFAAALLAGGSLVAWLTGRGVEWSMYPMVRGSAGQAAVIALAVAALAVASELVLRGWIVERVLELASAPPGLAVLVGAFAEAVVTPGDLAARIGAGAFGAGLGWIYVKSGRSLLAPISARLAFALAGLVLETLQLIG